MHPLMIDKYNVIPPFSCTDCDYAKIMSIETDNYESNILNSLSLLNALPLYANSSYITIYSNTSHTQGEYIFKDIKETEKEPYKCKIRESFSHENICFLHTLNIYTMSSVNHTLLHCESKNDLFLTAYSISTHYMILVTQIPFSCIYCDIYFFLIHSENIISRNLKHE